MKPTRAEEARRNMLVREYWTDPALGLKGIARRIGVKHHSTVRRIARRLGLPPHHAEGMLGRISPGRDRAKKRGPSWERLEPTRWISAKQDAQFGALIGARRFDGVQQGA